MLVAREPQFPGTVDAPHDDIIDVEIVEGPLLNDKLLDTEAKKPVKTRKKPDYTKKPSKLTKEERAKLVVKTKGSVHKPNTVAALRKEDPSVQDHRNKPRKSKDMPPNIKEAVAAIQASGRLSPDRASIYRPEYAILMLDYFGGPLTSIESRDVVTKSGEIRTISEIVPNKLPMFVDFARTLGVYYITLTRWVEKHDDFAEAWRECKEMQKAFMIHNAMAGRYNSTFTIFTAKNITDMRDTVDVAVKQDITVEILPYIDLSAPSNLPGTQAGVKALPPGKAAYVRPPSGSSSSRLLEKNDPSAEYMKKKNKQK